MKQLEAIKKNGLLWFCCAQTLILTAFYWPWLSNSSSYFFRDLTHYIEPFARFTGTEMAKGNFPLWNPWTYCGMSQVAITLQSICYPPTWLFACLPFNPALALTMLLHQVILGMGTFLLVRRLGWGDLAATAGAITLSLSAYCFCFTSIFSLVESAAWCPLLFWALSCLKHEPQSLEGRRRAAKFTWIVAISLAMQILAGYPDITAYELALMGAYVLYTAGGAWRSGKPAWLSELFLQARAIGLGFLLAMPLLLPAFEWLPLSRRSAGLDLKEALVLSANWYDVLGLLLPQVLGDMQLRWSEFRPLANEGQMLPYMASAFVGSGCLSLALWGVSDDDWKERFLFLALFLVMLALALGSNTPLAPLILSLSKIPIRFPVKLMFFVVWGISMFAARGLYACSQRKTNIYRLSTALAFLTAAAGGALLAHVHLFDPLLHFTHLDLPLQELLRKAEPLIGSALLWASVASGIYNLAGFLYARKRLIYFPQIMLAISCAILLNYAWGSCHIEGPQDYFQSNSIVADKLQELRGNESKGAARVVGLYIEHFTVPNSYLEADNVRATIKMYQYSRQVLRTNTNIDFKVPSSFGFEGTCTGDYFFFFHNCYGKSSQAYREPEAPFNDTALARFCQMSSTRFALTQAYRFGASPESLQPVPALDGRLFNLRYENPAMNIRIYEVANPCPRAYFASLYVFARRETILSTILDSEKSGFNPRRITLLEGAQLAPKNAAVKMGDEEDDQPVTIESEQGNSFSVSLEAKEPGFLVLTDQMYPGWTAELDGKNTDIVTANGFYRAVAVTAGKHLVRFSYQPRSFWAGMLLCLIAIIWMLGLTFAARRSKN